LQNVSVLFSRMIHNRVTILKNYLL